MTVKIEDIDTLLKDVSARLQAMPEALTEEKVKAITNDVFKAALEDKDSEFYRKMRFAASPPALIGSKYARWGLSVGDIEFLYDMLSSAKSVGLSKGPSEELENCFKAVSEAYYLPQEEVRRIDIRAIDNLFPRVTKHNAQAFERALKAMDSAETGYGLQLIGAQYVGELWEAAARESRVFALIDSFEMTDPTAYLPVEVDIPELLYVSESTASDASDYTTVKTGSQRVTVSAVKFVIHQMWSGELEEDSIIPFIPFLRRQATLSISHYSDSLVLNGDTTNLATGNINLDDADPADTKHYLAFDGIRHVGLVDNTNNQKDAAGAVTLALLKGQKSRMIDSTRLVDWGHPRDGGDLVYVCDPETGEQIALIDEVLTLDKFGQRATILTGQLAAIGVNPLITSMAVSKTEADGKVSTTAGNNTKGQVVAFNRRGFKVGWRRRIKLETERKPSTDQTRLIYSMRMGFGRFTPTGAASGIEAADVLFNITV